MSSRSSRPTLPREFMLAHKEARMTDAIASAIAEARSYDKVKIGHIVGHAGVARATFYEVFKGKDECFLAAVRRGFNEAHLEVETAVARADSLEERVGAAVDAIANFMEGHREYAYICLVESHAGAPMIREEAMENFAKQTGLPSPKGELLVGGVSWLLYRHLVEGAPSIEELRPNLRKFILEPLRDYAAAA